MPQLTCDISQTLWSTLQAAARQNGETISHLVSRALADDLQVEHATLFQVSTPGALVEGVLDGAVSVAILRQHGDFGLGTYADLDGEMIVLDGEFYQVRSDGSIHRPADDQLAPFAMVTHFVPDRTVTMDTFSSISEMLAQLDVHCPDANLFYAARLRGRFAHVYNRATCKVAPNEALVQAAAQQGEFHVENVSGTMVGFRMPGYVKTIGLPGWHVHFLSEDHARGGHVLGASGQGIELALELIDDFRLALPETASFIASNLSRDTATVLDKAETAPA